MYFVSMLTSILNLHATPEEVKAQDVWCVGYFEDLAVAQEIVAKNVGSIDDHAYSYAVIEKIGPGLYPYAQAVAWYAFERETNTFQPITVAPTGIVNYAMG